MRPIHARYPFLEAARAAVEDADVDLLEIVEDPTDPVRERARLRIDEAIRSGRVDDPRRDVTVEVLSYPLARVLVSLIDRPALTARYAEAEAARAYDLFTDELERGATLRRDDGERLTLDMLLTEFELEEPVSPGEGGYRIDVWAYLSLATELGAGRWQLVNRPLEAGAVPITRTELFTLLREAVRRRVADGLPLAVPDPVATALETEVERIGTTLADVSIPGQIDVVDPAAFPPCIEALLARADAGQSLPAHSTFTLVSFLAAIGMDPGQIAARFDEWLSAEELQDRFERLHGETRTAAYPPPSCETLQTYGDCVNMDALCEQIAHPLEYYQARLDGAAPDASTLP